MPIKVLTSLDEDRFSKDLGLGLQDARMPKLKGLSLATAHRLAIIDGRPYATCSLRPTSWGPFTPKFPGNLLPNGYEGGILVMPDGAKSFNSDLPFLVRTSWGYDRQGMESLVMCIYECELFAKFLRTAFSTLEK